MCPRGQFIQIYPSDPYDPWKLCSGQEDRKCAEHCYARYFSGSPDEREQDLSYWTGWVEHRMNNTHIITELVDIFIAPSYNLLDRYRKVFKIPESKLLYLDYGFDLSRLEGRSRVPGEPFTFGYIGTHTPAKGIHLLLRAFAEVKGEPLLRIWGRPRGENTEALKSIANRFPANVTRRIEWHPEYRNKNIVRDVFDYVDAIVVPSIWVENSPLVIHEAQQARIPVITANRGGMSEYVHHEVNGLLFAFRSWKSLAKQMNRLVREPELATYLGARGYLFSDNGDVPSIEEHVREIENIYIKVINRRNNLRLKIRPGPWRITFDTNPDDCNLRCLMCEEHSPYTHHQNERRNAGRPPRRMSVETIRRVVASASLYGLREIIPSTMGEPLLYEGFEDILSLCAEYGILLNLTTNGTFPRLGAKAWAERIVPITSDIKISWNGSSKTTQERIMMGSRWERHIDNVRAFIAVRDKHAADGGNYCQVTFQLTFMEANFEELSDIVRLAIDLGVDRVKGHHLWVHCAEMANQSMLRNPDAIRRWNKAVQEAQRVSSERTLQNGKHILLKNIYPLVEDNIANLTQAGPCPFLGQEAWISADGRFHPCCAPDDLRRSLGSFGSVCEQDFIAIWHGEYYKRLVATYRNRTLCLQCIMRKRRKSNDL